MTDREFKHCLTGAEAIRQTTEGIDNNFWEGYARGLRRHFHGEDFGTAAEHAKWLALADDHLDQSREMRGIGYRCGCDGLLIARAIARVDELTRALTIGERLRDERARRGISQTAAAREIGISLPYVAGIELGRIPAEKTARKIEAWLARAGA